MPLDLATSRRGPLLQFAAAHGAGFDVLPPASRLILRGRPTAIATAGQAFGIGMPKQACRAVVQGERAALWLGPDEWLLLAPENQGAALTAALERAMGGGAHSLADVSHRQIALEITGEAAATTLNAGCPLDLDPEAFPVGMCTRTVFAKSEIVLWRSASLTFHLEVWRSYAMYVWRVLNEASCAFRHELR